MTKTTAEVYAGRTKLSHTSMSSRNISKFHVRFVIPTAFFILTFLVARSFQVILSTNQTENEALIEQTAIVGTKSEHVTTTTTIHSRNNEVFSRFKHLPPNETMHILKDLGSHDKYDGGALRCNSEPYRDPELYWYDYSTQSFHEFNSTRRLLIAQSAGFGTYAQLLDLTAPINKAYARKWGQTILVLQGTLVVLQQEMKTNCTPPEHRSTHNKMQLLKFALRLKDHYDYLLILDADAMIYDFSVDLSNLMPNRAMMAANRVIAKKGVKKRATWKINAGVTLWNLHHRFTSAVADGWTKAAVSFMNGRNNNQGDQLFLYHVLKNNATIEQEIYSFGKEFHYNKATVIKHIKRPQVTYEIGQTSLDSRSAMITQFIDEICKRFPHDCEHLDTTSYSTI